MPQGFENFVPLSFRKQSLSLSGEICGTPPNDAGDHRDVHVKTDTEANKLANRQEAHCRRGKAETSAKAVFLIERLPCINSAVVSLK